MKSFKEYLAEEAYAYENPIVGDMFAFEIREEQLVETVVTSLCEDGIIIELDDQAVQILESYGLLTLAEQGQPGAHPVDSISPVHGGVDEAKYRGREVSLGKPFLTPGGPKKRSVYVKNPKTGNIKKVNFGDPNMRIKKSSPNRRKSFRARHRCANPGPRTSARYWSCRAW